MWVKYKINKRPQGPAINICQEHRQKKTKSCSAKFVAANFHPLKAQKNNFWQGWDCNLYKKGKTLPPAVYFVRERERERERVFSSDAEKQDCSKHWINSCRYKSYLTAQWGPRSQSRIKFDQSRDEVKTTDKKIKTFEKEGMKKIRII